MRDKEGWEIYMIREASPAHRRALMEALFDHVNIVSINRGSIPDLDERHDRISVILNEDTASSCAFVSEGPFAFWQFLFALGFLRQYPEFSDKYTLETLRGPVLETASFFPTSSDQWTPRAVTIKNEFRKPLNKSALEIVSQLESCKAGIISDPWTEEKVGLGVPRDEEGDFLVNLRFFNIIEEIHTNESTS